jgi:hypothetical protein
MEEKDRRGTWRDWPVGIMLIGALALIAAESEQPVLTQTPAILGWAAIVFGAVSLGIRRGAFTPRDR